MKNSASLTSEHLVICYLAIVLLYCLILSAKKLYYKYKTGQEYLILPKLSIYAISSISMMTAMNIALIITISLLSNQIMGIFFKVYPGARFLIENILIKLGGIMFGPIVGLSIGFITDLLTIIFTSSVLNYGYLFAAMINGFLGGMIYQIIRLKSKHHIQQTICSLVLSLLSLASVGIDLYMNSGHGPFQAKVLSFVITIPWYALFIVIALLVSIAMSLIIISTFATIYKDNPAYSYKPWVHIMSKKYLFFLILLCNSSIYLFVDMVSLPMFDVKLSSLPYEQFLIARIITSIPSIVLFSYIIHYIYRLNENITRTSASKPTQIVAGLQPLKSNKQKEFLPRLSH